MKSTALVLCLAAAVAAHAQTAAKPAAPGAKPAAPSAKPAAPAKTATAAASAAVTKYPPGKKAEPAIKKTLFSLRVQDLKIGTGAEVAPGWYKVKYTGWRAADGVVFDSWDQHPTPLKDKDGKPEMDADGKPKVGPPEPVAMPLSSGRMIPGFDHGFEGMHIGGVRRIFVPAQLGYGSHAIPDRTDHPGIPANSDLVFEVEVVDKAEAPAPPAPPRPVQPQGIPPGVPGGPAPPKPATPPSGTPPGGGATGAPPAPAQPSPPPQPSQPSTPPQPQ
jgi:peptidylprolyl isomerase